MSAVVLFLVVPLLLTQSNQASARDSSKLNFTSLGGIPPRASFTHSPTIPTPGEVITFDASGSYDPDGSIVRYRWNFGEGNMTVVTYPVITHSYPADGNYTVELTVTDNNGLNGVASAVVQVSTEVFFRVVVYGTLIPLSHVNVTVYYKNGSTWFAAPTGSHGLEIKYDLMSQPGYADTDSEKYRNPGTTATILRHDASNIGFDVHPASAWTVFFKFQWGPYVTYWPNQTTRVYSYKEGAIESHDYLPCHQAYWDSAVSTYVIRANDIPDDGVAPTSYHPIIVGMLAPPPPTKYYLTVRTSPTGVATVPGEGWYISGTDVALTAPVTVDISSGTRYSFSYWDVDGASKGNGVNPITINLNANHTAMAHYTLQYAVTFDESGLSDPTGTVVTVDGVTKALIDLPFTKWVNNGASVSYLYNTIINSGTLGKRFRLGSVTGSASPITVTAPATVTAAYITQYSVTFGQTGLDTTSTGTVLSINGAAKTYSQLPNMTWVDSGSSITYSYSAYVSNSNSGKRFRLASVTGPSSPILVLGPTTVTASYTTQYSVTFGVTGLDSSSASVVVTINGDAKTYSDLPIISWVDSGSSVTYSYHDVVLSNVLGKRFKQTSVSGPSSPVVVTGSVTITGNYKVQYQVTFDQTGVGSDFTGAVVTVDSVNFAVAVLPNSYWWDSGSSHTFSFASPLSVVGKQYVWSSTSGLSSLQSATFTVTGSGNVIGNYMVQSEITFDQTGISSDFTGTVIVIDGVSYGYSSLPMSFLWNVGSTHNFAFQSPLVVAANSKQYVWTSTTGLSTLQSGSITVAAYGSIVGNYKTQYYVALVSHSPTPSGTGWYDAGTFAAISAPQYGDIVPSSSRYSFAGWTTADMSEITDPQSPSTTLFIDQAKTVDANYVIQYAVIFNQTGVGSDFVGAVVIVDGTSYNVSALPTPLLWWDNDSSHAFAFSSPLTVDVTKSYDWVSTTGLSTLQSGTLVITGSGSVTGNYVVHTKCQITFDTTGLDIDPSGTIVTIDGVNYGLTNLPVSFWWDTGSSHTYTFTEIINVGSGKRYVLDSVTGLSTLPSGTIIVSWTGSTIGHYKTQYYLTLATNPVGVTSPSGQGWYDSGTLAPVSTTAFVDIVPGSSRYRFNGWSTSDMAEITDPTISPTSVLMDKAKTVSACYAVQDFVTFAQSGVGSDFSGTVVTVDGVIYARSGLPVSFWWDQGSAHVFSYVSPLVVTPDAKQYAWSNTAGLSSQQSESLTLTTYGSITGNYKTQYRLSVTSPFGSPSPISGWFDSGTSITTHVTSPESGPAGTQYVCTGWTGSGSAPASGTGSSMAFTITSPSSITWTWKTQYYLVVRTSPTGVATILGEGWYDTLSNVPLSAPSALGYDFQYWNVDGSPQGTGVTSITVTMNAPRTAIVLYSSASIAPVGGRSMAFSESSPFLASIYVSLIAFFSAALILTRRKRR